MKFNWIIKFIILIFIFIFLTLILITGCDHSIPERKIINDRLHIITHQGEVALIEINHLYKDNGEVISLGDDKVIIQKNFVAYALHNDTVILCEEKGELQVFWTYGIKNKSLNEYESYSELCEFCSYNDFKWQNLWVADFYIKQ